MCESGKSRATYKKITIFRENFQFFDSRENAESPTPPHPYHSYFTCSSSQGGTSAIIMPKSSNIPETSAPAVLARRIPAPTPPTSADIVVPSKLPNTHLLPQASTDLAGLVVQQSV